MRVIELFGGIGSCTGALKELGMNVDIVDYVEIDKFATQSYNAINNTNFEPQDIVQWDKDLKDIDLIMHGSPCQSISIAGLQKGADKNSGTASSLMWETVRIIEKIKPKYVIWENVKNLLSEKHRHNFDEYLSILEGLGYVNYYKVLNSKNFGVPQNRERIFTISIKKDINKTFKFPEGYDSGLRLKDFLEAEVDERYYISQEITESFIKKISEKEISKTTRVGGRSSLDLKHEWDLVAIKQVGLLDIKGNEQIRRVYDPEGISPTLNTMQGGSRQPKIIAQCGRYNSDGVIEQQLEVQKGDFSNIITTVQKDNLLLQNYRIRKLIPLECWRLQGFKDEVFYKAKNSGVSDSQLYKQAGNSITVNVLMFILKNLLIEE